MNRPNRRWALTLIAGAVAAPAFADHPGEDLDTAMFEKERHFQIIDEPQAPPFELEDAAGNTGRLSDFADKVVVLQFIYASCPDVCPLHADKIASIQDSVNATPMRDLVQFISITTDPKNDTAEVLEGYGENHGLDPANWVLLTRRADQPDDATRDLAKRYGLEFTMTAESDLQTHGAVTHGIDRGGRFAAKFHGLEFDDVNAVLYINGLINNAQHRERQRTEPPGWLDRVKDLFN